MIQGHPHIARWAAYIVIFIFLTATLYAVISTPFVQTHDAVEDAGDDVMPSDEMQSRWTSLNGLIRSAFFLVFAMLIAAPVTYGVAKIFSVYYTAGRY